MSARSPVSIVEHFADLTDPPRREGTYPLMTFLVVGVCAVHCGADDFVALGCQVKIAQAIVDGGGNYVLAVKGNQKSLYNSIDRFWNDHSKDDFARVKVDRHHTQERGHGREERREYVIRAVPESFPDRQRWPQWKAIGIAVNHTLRDGKWTRDVRCYILSVLLTARRFGEAARGHWAIENRCHWQLDVTFQEDQCRLRKGHSDANFAVLRRMAISLLKNHHGSKVGIKNKRLIAALNEQYLTEVLLGK